MSITTKKLENRTPGGIFKLMNKMKFFVYKKGCELALSYNIILPELEFRWSFDGDNRFSIVGVLSEYIL